VSRPFLNVSGAASRRAPGDEPPSSTGADFTKLQRSACAGSNYGWIMWDGVESVGQVKWEMIEEGGDGGERGRVTAC